MQRVGVILPWQSDRFKPSLRWLSAGTLFAFVMTSVIPSGWAAQRVEENHLRGQQTLENDEMLSGLEEDLKEQPAPPQTGVTRRDVLKAAVVTGTAATVLGSTQNTAQAPPIAPAQTPARQPRTPWSSVRNASQISDINVPTGWIDPGRDAAFENTLVVNQKTRQVAGPVRRFFLALRAMIHPKPFWFASLEKFNQTVMLGVNGLKRRMGYDQKAPALMEVVRTWNPGRFAPENAQPVGKTPPRSYVVWEPWTLEEDWWPDIFLAMRKAAGVGPDSTEGYHSRIYLDPYGFLRPDRPWEPKAVSRFLVMARQQGVQVVPLLGHPLWAKYPDLGLSMVRQLASTGFLIPEEDGRIHISFDVEPHELEDYQDDKERYWRNVLEMVEEVQKRLSVRFEQKAFENYDGAEITLHVPPEFFDLIQRYKMVVPRGTQLALMAYADTPERVAAHVQNARNAFRNSPDLLKGVAFSVEVDIGPASNRKETLWADPEGRYSGERVGERTKKVGELLGPRLQGVNEFTGEYILHTHDTLLDLVPFLQKGGLDPHEEADRDLMVAAEKASIRIKGALEYLSARPPALDPARYGELPDGRPGAEVAQEAWNLLVQRMLSGAVATGAIAAHWHTAYDTLMHSLRSGQIDWLIHRDTFLLGPDLGILWAAGLLAHDLPYSNRALISQVSRTAVDPSRVGDAITLGEGEKAMAWRLKKDVETQEQGLLPAGTLIAVGTVLPASVTLKDVEMEEWWGWGKGVTRKGISVVGDGSTVIHGTRLPDGQIVPGLKYSQERDILTDGSDARRRNDVEPTQLPSNGYDLYWTVEIHNFDQKPFGGYLRILPHTGQGEPLEIGSTKVKLEPGTRMVQTVKLLVGYDDDGLEAHPLSISGEKRPGRPMEPDGWGIPAERRVRDPFDRRGRLHRNVQIREGIYLINTVAAPEISDAAGEASYDPLSLSQSAHDQRFRPELAAKAKATLQNQNISEISLYSVDRPVGRHLELQRGQDARAAVRAAASSKQRDGVTQLVVEAAALYDFVDEFRRIRNGDSNRKRRVREKEAEGMKVGAHAQEWRIYKDLMNHPSVVQLREMLDEVRKQGLRVSLLIDAEKAPKHGDDQEEFPELTATRDFFRILKNSLEVPEFGLNTFHSTIMYNQGRLKPEDLSWASMLFLNAQAPMALMSNSDAPVPVPVGPGILKVTGVHDLRGAAHARVVRELETARAAATEKQPLGLVLLSAGQLAAAPVLPATDESAEKLVTLLVGPKVETGRSQGGVVTPRWVADQILELRNHQTPVREIFLDAFPGGGLRKIRAFSTGHLSVQAEMTRPDPSRSFVLRFRMFDLVNGLLTAVEVPVAAGQFDLTETLRIVTEEMTPSTYVTEIEVVQAVPGQVIPGIPQINDVPLLIEKPADDLESAQLWPVNLNADAPIPSGSHRLKLGQEAAIEVEAVDPDSNQPVHYPLEEHWTLQIDGAGPLLHFGRDRERERLFTWLDGASGQATLLKRLSGVDNVGSEIGLGDGAAVPVKLAIGGNTGRVEIQANGRTYDLWNLVDLKGATKWDRWTLVSDQIPTPDIKARPDHSVPDIRTLNGDKPVKSREVPLEVRDITDEQVTPYSRRSERTGNLLGIIAAGVGAYQVARSAMDRAVRFVRKVPQEINNPNRSQLTRNENNTGGRIRNLVRESLLLVLLVFVVVSLPEVGAPVGFLALSPVGGWAVKLLLVVPLAAKWLVDGLGAMFPGLGNWVAGAGSEGPSNPLRATASFFGQILQGIAKSGRLVAISIGVLAFFQLPVTSLLAPVIAAGSWVIDRFALANVIVPLGAKLFPWIPGAMVAMGNLPASTALHQFGEWLLLQKVAALGLGGWIAGILVAVLAISYVVSIARNRGAEGIKDLGDRTLQSVGVLAALAAVFGMIPPLAAGLILLSAALLLWAGNLIMEMARRTQFDKGRTMLAKTRIAINMLWAKSNRGDTAIASLLILGALTGLAVLGPAALVPMLAGVTVAQLIGWYLSFRLAFFFSRFIAEHGKLISGGVMATAGFIFTGTLPARAIFGFIAAIIGFQTASDYTGIGRHWQNWLNDQSRKIHEKHPWISEQLILPDVERAPLFKVLLSIVLAWVVVAPALKAIGGWIMSPDLMNNLIKISTPTMGTTLATWLSSPWTLQLILLLTLGFLAVTVLFILPSKLASFRNGILPPRMTRRSIGFAPGPNPNQPRTREQINAEITDVVLEESQRRADLWIEQVVTDPKGKGFPALKLKKPKDWPADPRNPDPNKPSPYDGPYPYLKLLMEAGKMQKSGRGEVPRADQLLAGFAAQIQAAVQMVQLDQSAAWSEGMLKLALPKLLRRLEMDPRKVASLPSILTTPHGESGFFGMKYFSLYHGAGIATFPIVWFSQGTQYLIAMNFRWMRGAQEGMDVIVLFPANASVESDMANDPEEFINLVMGRWLEGHREILMKMFGGQTFHLDPNVLQPKGFERRFDSVRDLRAHLEGQVAAGGPDADRARVALGYLNQTDTYFVDEFLGSNLTYGTGPSARPTNLTLRNWNDDPGEGGPGAYDVSDEDSLKTRHLDAGNWVVRVLGPTGNYLYMPILPQARESEDGTWRVEVADHPGKLHVAFTGLNPAGEEQDLGTPSKAFWMGSAIQIMPGYIPFVPRATSDGEVEWVSPYSSDYDSTLSTGPEDDRVAAEILAGESAREEVVEARETERDLANETHWDQGEQMYADGQYYSPNALPAAGYGYERLGPNKGHKPFDTGYGRFWQAVYRVGDLLIGRRIAAYVSMADMRDAPRKSFWQVLSSLPLLFPWGAVGIGMLAKVFPSFGLPWLPWLLIGVSLWIWAVWWLVRSQEHALSYYGPRKQAVSEAMEASADPADALRLTAQVTGRELPPLPEDARNDAGYVALVREGITLLQNAGVYQYVVELGRAVSPEGYRRHPNRSREAWERYYVRRIQRGLDRLTGVHSRYWEGRADIAAAERAILQIMMREHFAVGNEIPEDMYRGTSSPDYQAVGLRSVPSSLMRYGATARVFSFFGAELNEGNINRPVSRRRTWAMGSETVNMGLPRMSSIFRNKSWTSDIAELEADIAEKQREIDGADSKKEADVRKQEKELLERDLADMRIVEEWRNLEGSPTGQPGESFLRFYRKHSHLQPDAEETVRTVALRSREHLLPTGWAARLLLSPMVRHSGMVQQGNDSRRLGEMPAIVAAVTAAAGFGLLKAGLALLGISISLPVSPLVFLGVVAGALIIPRLLESIAHGLDVGGPRGQWINRRVGALGSAALGGWMAWAAYQAIQALSLGWGSWAILGTVLGWGAVAVILGVTAIAVFAAFASMRLDMHVVRGPRGDGIRAIGLIPGLLIQYPLTLLFKTVVLTLNGWLPEGIGVAAGVAAGWGIASLGVGLLPAIVAGVMVMFTVNQLLHPYAWWFRQWFDVPKSLDLQLLSRWMGVPMEGLTGLSDRLEHPVVFGTAFAPGKLLWRLVLLMRRVTAENATPIPLGVIGRLGAEWQEWRYLSGNNLLPHPARDFGEATAEDTDLGWMLSLMNVAEPASPAISLHKLANIFWWTQERRDEEGSIKRAYQFYKGMSMADAIRRMRDPDGDALQRLIARLIGQVQREQVLTGARRGASVYAYLFTSFTARQLYMKMVGLFAPGEVEAFWTYLYYEIRDRELDGRLSRQMLQMNQEQPDNPLVGEQRAGSMDLTTRWTFEDTAVRAQLARGWAVDPRAALAGALAAKEKGVDVLPGTTETVDLRKVFVRTMGGWAGTYQIDAIESIARQRKTVDLLTRFGKHRFIRLNKEILAETHLVRAVPLTTLAGLEEPTPEQLKNAKDVVEKWARHLKLLSGPEREAKIRDYAERFDAKYEDILAAISIIESGDLEATMYDIDEDNAFPEFEPNINPENVAAGKRAFGQTAFLLGAGGAGGRLFEDMEKVLTMIKFVGDPKHPNPDRRLGRIDRWGGYSVKERRDLIRDLNDILKSGGRQLLPTRLADVTSERLAEKKIWLEEEINRQEADLIYKLGLDLDSRVERGARRLVPLKYQHSVIPEPAQRRFRDLLNKLDAGVREKLITKPTFSLGVDSNGNPLPSPLEIWMRTLAVMGRDLGQDPVVVMGVSPMTKNQIMRFLKEAYQGLHGSEPGTYFGLRGPIAMVNDDTWPVIVHATKKLAEEQDGTFMEGGTGGAGSMVALAKAVEIYDPPDPGDPPDSIGTVHKLEKTVTAMTAFDWLEQQGKNRLYIGDGDTIGTTPEMIYNSIGLMERKKKGDDLPPMVLSAYPYPAPIGGKPQARGRWIRAILNKGQPNQRIVTIGREAKPEELKSIRRLQEVLKVTPPSVVPANAGTYLFSLAALKQVVTNALAPDAVKKGHHFPMHIAKRPAAGYLAEQGLGKLDVDRLEYQKPDFPEMWVKQTEGNFEPPIAGIPDGQVIPIKDPSAVIPARERLFALAKLLGLNLGSSPAGLEEPEQILLETPVPDDQLLETTQRIVNNDHQRGLIPDPSPDTDRFSLPGLPVGWFRLAENRGIPLPNKPEMNPPIVSRLDERRLRYNGESSGLWTGHWNWRIHGSFPQAEGHAMFVADFGAPGQYDIIPFDANLAEDMVRMAVALPGYRVFRNYSRKIGDSYFHLGRSVPEHEHIHAVPMVFPAEIGVAPQIWGGPVERNGVRFRKSQGTLPWRIRLIEGEDPMQVARALAEYTALLDAEIEKGTGEIKGYNISIDYSQAEGILRAYVLPGRKYLDPELTPVDAKTGYLMSLSEYQANPDKQRSHPLYIGWGIIEMMGGITTPDRGTYERYSADPAGTAQVISKLLDDTSTFTQALAPIDQQFLKAAGLEEPGTATRVTFQYESPLPAVRQATPPSQYMSLIREILEDRREQARVLQGLGWTVERLREVRIIHHEFAYADEGPWYLWIITFVDSEGREAKAVFKVLAPNVQPFERNEILVNNDHVYGRPELAALPSVPKRLASGEWSFRGATYYYQVVEFVPEAQGARNSDLLVDQAIRFWEASAESPTERFLPWNLEPGGTHFFRDAAGTPQMRFLNFDALAGVSREEIPDFVRRQVGLEEKTLAEAAPLESVFITRDGVTPLRAEDLLDYSQPDTVLAVLVAGKARRWDKELSKVLEPLPFLGTSETRPAGFFVVSAAQSMNWPVVAVVNHQMDQLIPAFNELSGAQPPVYVRQEDPVAGTGDAAWGALGVLRSSPNTVMVIVPGDQPFFDANVLRDVRQAHVPGVDLAMGTVVVEKSEQAKDKGRIIRMGKGTGEIVAILEQADINAALKGGGTTIPEVVRQAGYTDAKDLDAIREINPFAYAVSAGVLEKHLGGITAKNAQGQFYLTDILARVIQSGGRVASVQIPAWKMPTLDRVDQLEGVLQTMRDHAGELVYTAGLEDAPSETILKVAVIAPSAVQDYSELTDRGGQLIHLGGGRHFLFLSPTMAGLEEPLMTLLGENKPIHFWQYGEPDDPALGAFQRTAAPFSPKWLGPFSPRGADGRAFLEQVLLALDGLEESAGLNTQDSDLLEEVLGLATYQ